MRRSALTRAVVRYLTTTTLHGFKYLQVPPYADRTVWTACCVASAGCAAALCLVLWARFAQVPTLLWLRQTDARAADVLPAVALCTPAAAVAARVVAQLNISDPASLTQALSLLLRGRSAPDYQLSYLQHELRQHGPTLAEMLLRVTPGCTQMLTRCQVDSRPINCEDVLHKSVTMYGACCVLRPGARSKDQYVFDRKIRTVEMVVNYPEQDIKEYDFLVQHEGKGWMKTIVMSPGMTYFAPLTFKYIVNDVESAIEGACVVDAGYSQTACMRECMEDACGCSDPMRDLDDVYNDDGTPRRAACSLARVACLRSQSLDSKTCNCYPSCKQVRRNISLRQNSMHGLKYYIVDPLYKGLVPNKSAVLKIQIEKIGSYVFARMPTETWLTLLSSLGGVFNMFLGVGLFSALELVYFTFIRIPLAIRKSMKMEMPSFEIPPRLSVK